MAYEGAQAVSPEELQRLGLAPKPQGPLAQPEAPKEPPRGPYGVPARQIQPGEKAMDMPQPGEMMAQNFRRNWPGILGMVGGLLPGGPVVGPLARAGAVGAINAGGKALQGDPNALAHGALAGGAQLGGEALLGGGLAAAQGLFRTQIGKAMANRVADYLREKVPAYKNFKTLRDMFLTDAGINSVHEAYDKALKDVVKKGATQDLVLPARTAKELGIPVKGAVDVPEVPMGAGPVPEQMVTVNAGDAANSAVGKWRKFPQSYATVNHALDSAGIGDPAARQAYKTAIGVKDYIDKWGGFEGKGLNPQKIHEGLSDIGAREELARRGLGNDLQSLFMPPGQGPITAGTHKLSGSILGGGLGAAAGGPLGLIGHGGGLVGGAYLGGKVGSMLPRYTNVIPPGLTGIQGPLSAGISGSAIPPVTLSSEAE